MPATSTPTVRRRRLGTELRNLRLAAQLAGDDAGRRLGWDASKVSRIETGRSVVKAADLARLLDLYGVDDPERRATLEALARDGGKRGWWQPYRDVLSEPYSDFIGLEAIACEEQSFELALVPGLLQIADYARVAISTIAPHLTSQEVNALVEVRVARQAALTKPDPLRLWAIIDEAALRHRLGGPRVMFDQLRRLRELTTLPNVTLQILPLSVGGHPGTAGSFTILRFPEKRDIDVVLLENLSSSLYMEQEADVLVYGEAFDRLRALALPFDDSRQVIADIMKELE